MQKLCTHIVSIVPLGKVEDFLFSGDYDVADGVAKLCGRTVLFIIDVAGR